MPRSLVAVAFATIFASPALASDFSFLAKPEFARSLLMSPQQREEMVCTEDWVSASADQPLAPLIAEMDDRHAAAQARVVLEAIDDRVAARVEVPVRAGPRELRAAARVSV